MLQGNNSLVASGEGGGGVIAEKLIAVVNGLFGIECTDLRDLRDFMGPFAQASYKSRLRRFIR